MRKRSSERGEAVTSGPRPLTWNLGKLSPEKGGGYTSRSEELVGGGMVRHRKWVEKHGNTRSQNKMLLNTWVLQCLGNSVCQTQRTLNKSVEFTRERSPGNVRDVEVVKTFTRWCWQQWKNLLDQSAAMSHVQNISTLRAGFKTPKGWSLYEVESGFTVLCTRTQQTVGGCVHEQLKCNRKGFSFIKKQLWLNKDNYKCLCYYRRHFFINFKELSYSWIIIK